MRIAVDCDGVLLDTVSHFLKHFYPNYRKEQIFQWNMHKILGITREEFMLKFKILNKYLSDFEHGAERCFNHLSCYHELDIVTVNPEEKRSQLEDKFKNLNYRDLILIDPADFKGKHILDYPIFIDDHPAFPNSIKRYKDKRLLLFDQPWNRDVNCALFGNVERVDNWEHIIKKLILS